MNLQRKGFPKRNYAKTAAALCFTAVAGMVAVYSFYDNNIATNSVNLGDFFPDADSGTAIFFSDKGFKGSSFNLKIEDAIKGVSVLRFMPFNDISSLKIGQGVKAELCHFYNCDL